MRKISFTSRFKRDYKRERSGRYAKVLDGALTEVVNQLAADLALPHRNVDHALPVNGRIIVIVTSSRT